MDAPALDLPPVESPPRRFSLTAWLPVLWRGVLFPGPSPSDPTAIRWPSLIALLFLPGVLLYPCLSFALFEPDESRYAQIPREMLERGEWIVPHLQGEPYLDKPPLFYWLVMASYGTFGISEASARLVPALAVHLTVLLVYLMGRRWVGERPAFLGALALGLSPGFLTMGRLLILDGLLTLWATLALFAAYEALRGPELRRGWWLLSAFACSLGVLTKGPVALVLLAVPLLLQGWLGGLCSPGWRWGLTFVALVLAVVLPWYVLVCVRAPDFAGYFLWEHNVLRFIAPFDHLRGVWFYVPIVLGGLLPATLLLIPFCRFLLSGEESFAWRRCPELGFVLLSGGWCLLFFTLSGCKLPTYILPAFPMLALAIGYFLAHSRWSTSRAPSLVASGTFGLLLVAHHFALPWYADYRSPVRQPEVLARYCADPNETVVCYPRPCNAVAFHLGRDDLKEYRSKEIDDLRRVVLLQHRTVILCTHRSSLEGLRQLLPPEVKIVETAHFGLPEVPLLPSSVQEKVKHLMGTTALGLSDLAVVENPRWKDQPWKKAPR